jgi:3',5'-cyclic AMP phosphodiesterase CpdA
VLGDNAYDAGSDAEYQAKHFAIYPNMLRSSVSWYTLGNHDAGTGSVGAHPYHTMFSLPTTGQAGGVGSGTENYYSFDYGNVHFISLDSQETNRSATGAMATWLKSDLQNNTLPWVIAFWHHPPYSKGSHDSDTETNLVEMRSNMLPVLEQHGVDLVLSGHSHSYERSYCSTGITGCRQR